MARRAPPKRVPKEAEALRKRILGAVDSGNSRLAEKRLTRLRAVLAEGRIWGGGARTTVNSRFWSATVSSALHAAIEKGHTGLVRLLLAKGADATSGGFYHRIGLRPLEYAVHFGRVAEARLLLRRGARTDTTAAVTGRTPLHFAAERNQTEMLELLVENGADVDAEAGYMVETPLHTAVEHNAPDAVSFLISHGANVNHRDRNGETPLFKSLKPLSYRGIKSLNLLLGGGADPYVKNKRGETVVHMAAREAVREERIKRPRLLSLLRATGRRGASLLDDNGRTPLHSVAEVPGWLRGYDAERATRLLLRYGADPNSQDNKGQTPLHLAVTRVNDVPHIEDSLTPERPKLVKALLSGGARADVPDENGETPLHTAYEYAERKGRSGETDSEVVRLLVESETGRRALGMESSFGRKPAAVLGVKIPPKRRYQLDILH